MIESTMISSSVGVQVPALSSLSTLLSLSLFLSLSSSLTAAQREHEIYWIIPSAEKPYYDPLGVANNNNDDNDGGSMIQVGDTLKFSWEDQTDGQHNVLIHPSGSCDDTDAVYLGATSPVEYTFQKSGVYTFACDFGMGTHCQLGQIINVTVTDSDSNSNSNAELEENKSKEENEEEEELQVEQEIETEEIDDDDDDDDVMEKYQQFFNPGEEQRMMEFKIEPFKVPHRVTTYQNFVFNLPPEMLADDNQIVHIVVGDVIISQPKHLHHFVLTGCIDTVDPSMVGVPSSYDNLRSCTIPLGGWAVGGTLFPNIPLNAGQVFGPGLGVKAISVNIHYTDGLDVDYVNTPNDGEYAIATDGIRILYTPNLRPKSVINKPLINVGMPATSAMNLPPNQSRYFYTKTCTVESSCKDSDDEYMNYLGSQMPMPGMETMTCESIRMFCFMPTGFERFLQMLCPISCGLCDGTNKPEYHLNGINYHAHITGREMYATLLSGGSSGSDEDEVIDLNSQELWLYDNQVTYPLDDVSSSSSSNLRNGNTNDGVSDTYVTVRPGDRFQASCVYDSTSRENTTYFGLSTYDEMCIIQVEMIIDTPNTTDVGQASLSSVLNLQSFSCVVDQNYDNSTSSSSSSSNSHSSDIWRGTLEPNEDARLIWKDHPISQSDCTYPVGTIFGGGLSVSGDAVPTGDTHCVSSSSGEKTMANIICFDAADDDVVFDADAYAGESCEGGTFDDKDSNDPSVTMLLNDQNGSKTFEEMCTGGGGSHETYTCKDTEDYLNGWDSFSMESEIREYMRIDWWQPKCCINNKNSSDTDDVEQQQEEEEAETNIIDDDHENTPKNNVTVEKNSGESESSSVNAYSSAGTIPCLDSPSSLFCIPIFLLSALCFL